MMADKKDAIAIMIGTKENAERYIALRSSRSSRPMVQARWDINRRR